MGKYFLSLFEPPHRKWTIAFFAAAALLIISSQIVGITDNLTGISMLITGMILVFFSITHPWKKAISYAILVAVCTGIILLEWFGIHILVRLNKTEYISEAVGMIIAFFICVPGILAGIIGVVVCSLRKN
jgi:hypothetical protein